MGRGPLETPIKYFIFDIGGVLIELKRRHFLVELSRFIRQPLWRLKWPLEHEILNEITCGRKKSRIFFTFCGIHTIVQMPRKPFRLYG